MAQPSLAPALDILERPIAFDHAEVEFEIRNLPGDDPGAVIDTGRAYAEQTLVPEMRAVHADSAIEWQPLSTTPRWPTSRLPRGSNTLPALLPATRTRARYRTRWPSALPRGRSG